MKIIIKPMGGKDQTELSVDPTKTTIEQFAKLYLDKLSETTDFTIEKNQYTLRNNLTPFDFQFIINGISFHSGKVPNKLLFDYINAN